MHPFRIVPIGRIAVIVLLVGAWSENGRADVKRFSVTIALDRTHPRQTLAIDDFRVNETLTAPGGVQYFILRQEDGVLQVPFDAVADIEFLRYLGVHDDLAMYDARVTMKAAGEPQTGRVELRVLLGLQKTLPWHVRLATSGDKGAGLYRIVFGGAGPPPSEPPKQPVC